MDFLFMFLKLVVALVIIIFLMMISLKASNKGLSKINSKRYMKVIDKVQLGKDSFITIVKIGDKGLIMSVTPNKTDILEEISLEEVEKVEREKKESIEDMTKSVDKVMELVKEKAKDIRQKPKNKKKLKEDNDEKV